MMELGNSLTGNEEGSTSSPPPAKKKRNLPGMPDPEAEVIALSPKTLLATNRFICEICNKGFQRDQNLQLHRRGHNLPWKLRQRTNNEIRKKVYVCPESTCVHHDPKRALGDLTGIKKHFFRKHGEKKWKCDRCSKNYAVKSDWKAHMKSCGTREYRCDCGTLFSRRDSFITHRAFCDALAQESARNHDRRIQSSSSSPPIQNSDQVGFLQPPSGTTTMQMQVLNPTNNNGFLIFPAPPAAASLSLYTTGTVSSSIYTGQYNNIQPQAHSQQQPAISATALLQKAAQVGAAAASSSYLCGLEFKTSENQPENSLRFPSGLDLMMGVPISNIFSNKPTTLDLLGMGIGGGVSSLITTMSDGGGGGGSSSSSGGHVFRGVDQQQQYLWKGMI